MSLSTGVRLGRYEIQELLGDGSMGEVYRAKDTRLGRDVAVKVLRPEFACDEERLGRFSREARAASALNHPNVVSLFDIGERDGAPYLVTELLQGETLRRRCQRARLDASDALVVAIQIARGLAAAHEKGIVHRDLKPENVFILPDGRVKVLDFGLAKLLDRGSEWSGETSTVTTEIGVVLGTVEYMSPEQMRGQPADHRSDLFSLGALTYEMLTGRTPFHRETESDTFQAILEADPTPLARCGVKASPALQACLIRCLEKSPAARFQSALELAAALEEVLRAPAIPEPEPKRIGARALAVGLGIVAFAVLAVLFARAFAGGE